MGITTDDIFQGGARTMIAPRLEPRTPCPHCGQWLPPSSSGTIPQPLPEHVIGPLLRLHGYSREDLASHAKNDRRLLDVRAQIYRALRDHGYSLPHIGRLVNRDHTTILYHLEKPQ